jgi:hypothetical protein
LAKEREQRWANMTELGEALALWLYEHGIKEDLSGNSIRAVWLDGVLSGVRADLPSSVPPSRWQDGSERITQKAPKLTSIESVAAARDVHRKGKQRQVFIIALALGLGFGGVAVALALGSKGKSTNAVAEVRAASVQPAPTLPAQPSASIAESIATPADLALSTDTITSKRTAPRAAPLPNKSAGKNLKRTHDFGF